MVCKIIRNTDGGQLVARKRSTMHMQQETGRIAMAKSRSALPGKQLAFYKRLRNRRLPTFPNVQNLMVRKISNYVKGESPHVSFVTCIDAGNCMQSKKTKTTWARILVYFAEKYADAALDVHICGSNVPRYSFMELSLDQEISLLQESRNDDMLDRINIGVVTTPGLKLLQICEDKCVDVIYIAHDCS